uniref:Uncharacterized protein n=1 Tax=Panagrolaimus sp. JU765 TaxID=591449 RepID=A0AC34RHG6_9BILA
MTGQSCLGRRDIRNHDDSHVYPFRPIIPAGMEGPPPYVPPGQRTRRTRNEILPPLPSYEDATKMPSLRQNIPSCNDEDDQVVFNGQSSPIEENPPNLPRQESINSNSSQVSCESATNVSVQGGGRACTIEYESENCAVVHPPSDSINRNMSEQMTSTDNDQLRRESSVRKSL